MRARFYASGNTLTPMIATTIITARFHTHVRAVFSDVLGHRTGHRLRRRHHCECAERIALLLHFRGMVPLGGLNWKELSSARWWARFPAD